MSIIDPSSDPIHLLVVDDDEAFVDLTAEVLRDRYDRFDVRTETNPSDALDGLDGTIDCIVSDYEMPGMDGIELLQAVRRTHPELPVILFTGKGNETIASEAISAGVTNYIEKETGLGQYERLAKQITNAVEKYRAERRAEYGLTAMETTSAGIAFLDDTGDFIYVNEAYSDMVGYERDTLTGTPWDHLCHDDDVERLWNTILPQAKAGGWTGQVRHLDTDGETVVVDYSVSCADDGTIICTVTDGPDQATAGSRSLKDQAMDAAPIGITIADATRPDNPIIYANDGFEALTGYAKEQILGESLSRRCLGGEDTDAQSIEAMRTALENEQPVTTELRNYRQDGTEFWSRVRIVPIQDGEGTVTHYVGFQQDITERKQTEFETAALLDQFEEFGSVLSHDLQKPLATARGRVELVRQTEDWDELENIDRTLSRLNTSINEFADAMREGQIAGDQIELDLESVSESTWTSIMPGSATLEVVGDPRIRADKQALSRLLTNLFRNAFEHGDDDVTVRVGASTDGFYVADDGPGIPEDRREKVFTPGFTTRDDGTGMGLTSVRQIVLAHGWEIAVTESQSGGTRFEITTRTTSQSTRESQSLNA